MQASIRGFRLSPQQRHLWLLYGDDASARHAECVVRIDGAVDADDVLEACCVVSRRHNILRTVFRAPPAMKVPVQMVDEDAGLAWRHVDLRDRSPEAQQTRIEELLQSERGLPFDLQDGPVLRLSLLTLTHTTHLLLITLPALCADIRSLRNFVRDVAHVFAAGADEYTTSEEPMQYVQFSEWQNELLAEDDAEEGQAYWRRQNYTALHAVTLPCTVPATTPDEGWFAPHTFTLSLEAGLVADAQALARAYGVSLDTVLLACWMTLLSRLTRSPELIVGRVFDGREYEVLDDALGPFAKALPLHGRLADSMTASDLCTTLDTAIQAAGEWQTYFTWEDIAGTEETTCPSFGFEFIEGPARYTAGGVSFSIDRQHVCGERFDVKLTCSQDDEAFTATFQYDANRFADADIARLGRRFQTLVARVLADPDAPLDHLSIVLPDEHRRLLVEFNTTAREYGADALVHTRFERQVEHIPDEPAVVFEDQHLSYQELNTRANQLAHYLQTRGVGPDVPVVLHLERSLEATVGLLGVLKAGGAYVPLDTEQPGERLRHMLDIAHPKVILSTRKHAGQLPEHHADVICLDEWDAIGQLDRENPTASVAAENLAYVIFTSGSTGRPKGVAVEHRQVLNYTEAMLSRLDLPADSSFATVSTLSADLGNTAIFPALCAGGCLHVMSAERVTDPAAFADYVSRHTIDCLKITPSHLAALMAYEYPERLLPRRRLVLGGEATNWTLVEELQSLDLECTIFNHYGPTETTVGVLTYRCGDADADPRVGTLPIGRPLANTRVYVLDEHMQPTPPWMTGELYVGGANVTRGYLHAAGQTAERFVPDPFGDEAGARLYRTGDLVRYVPAGYIEFLGRADDQIKLRGYRIELGEIEAVLSRHPDVQAATVVVHDDESNREGLVAYLVMASSWSSSVETVREFLNDRLPSYMIPGTLIQLDALPLTPNGKVDHEALPVPDALESDSTDAFVAPETPLQQRLADIWADVLERERIGIHDNFFALGGHSLLATQLVSRIRKAFEIELPLRSLFSAASVAELAALIESDFRDETQLLAPPIEPAPRDGRLPLSFAQQRLWFLDQLTPGNPAYNIYAALELEGPLDVEALERALTELIGRHEILRTTFPTRDGRPEQRIAAPHPVTIPVEDVQDLSDDEQDAEVQRRATATARRPFDLANGPLLRVRLLRLGEARHVMLLSIHHIISDGWSTGVLVRELGALYDAFSAGTSLSLPELPIQYADVAIWQREWLEGDVLERHLDYWKGQLADAPPALQLPTDRPRPAVPSYRGATRTFALSGSLTRSLVALSRQEDVTLFVTLLSAFSVLLHRYTGEEDILVGTPIANRNWTELEDLIGFFVNTLVLRTDLSGDPSFREVLGRVRDVALDAYAHQDLPFEKLVDELDLERDMSHTPLFQVMFVLQNAPAESLELSGLTIRRLRVNNKTTKFDLTLNVEETPDGLRGTLEYRTDLFEPATIERMLGHFETLLEQSVAAPDRSIGDLPLLTPAERRRLLGHGNDTVAVASPSTCLHTRFEARVEQTPDAIAVVFEDRQMTYRELNRRANKLAHYLRKRGLGAGTVCGLYLERSLELVVAVVGILKAGAAYLPLDSVYPRERLRFMLDETRASALVTREALVEDLPATEIPRVCLDTDRDAIAREADTNPSNHTTANDLAYVMYTSGSTGKPKGVMVTHRNVVRLFDATQAWFEFDATDVWTLFHTITFDFSVWELWGALLYGGRLVVVPFWMSRTPEAFYTLLQDERVTVLNQTPSAFRQLIPVDERRRAARSDLALRYVIFGGEALNLQNLRPWFARHGDERPQLVNMYGITETTVHVTYRPIAEADLTTTPGSVIGAPLPDLRVYILDRNLEPAPIGVPGEVYVGGGGVSHGYLRRPALTAERFIPDPFADEPGARLYRTGDLARRLSDGDIEYRGRIDFQRNVRGFRIELGEIEAALNEHPAVRESVVLAREDDPDRTRLVAYVMAREERRPSVEALRQFLGERVPEYMVPAAFVMLDAFPLTPNGKIDRRALPAPAETRPALAEGYTAPRTPTEELLAAIWSTVLDIERVGVHDNFFALGGDSILSVRIAGLARQRGLDVSVQQLFQHQTIHELAQRVSASDERAAIAFERTTPLGLIADEDRRNLPAGVEDAYPVTMLQAGMLYHMKLQPEFSPYHNVTSFLLRAPFDGPALQKAAQYAVGRHEVLRTAFDLGTYSEPLQLVHPSAEIPVTWDDIRHLSSEEQDAAIEAFWEREWQRPFDLAQPALLRFHVHRRTNDTFQFTLTEFHPILDGWSLMSTLAEIFDYYFALLSDEEPDVSPPPAVSYRDFVRLEQQTVRSDAQRAFWRRTLQGCTSIKLPRWPSLVRETHGPRVRVLEIPIDRQVTDQLRDLARSVAVPLKSVLLAAHVKVMQLVSGQSDILTGLSVNGRPEVAGGADVRGLFLNVVPFRLQLASESWTELAKLVFETESDLLPYRRYPLAAIQNDHGDEPLFETLFNYLHFHSVEDVLHSHPIEVLRNTDLAETNYTQMAAFHVSPATSDLILRIHGNKAELPPEQVEALADCYLGVLVAMASSPEAPHTSLDVTERWHADVGRSPAGTHVPELDAEFTF